MCTYCFVHSSFHVHMSDILLLVVFVVVVVVVCHMEV